MTRTFHVMNAWKSETRPPRLQCVATALGCVFAGVLGGWQLASLQRSDTRMDDIGNGTESVHCAQLPDTDLIAALLDSTRSRVTLFFSGSRETFRASSISIVAYGPQGEELAFEEHGIRSCWQANAMPLVFPREDERLAVSSLQIDAAHGVSSLKISISRSGAKVLVRFVVLPACC